MPLLRQIQNTETVSVTPLLRGQKPEQALGSAPNPVLNGITIAFLMIQEVVDRLDQQGQVHGASLLCVSLLQGHNRIDRRKVFRMGRRRVGIQRAEVRP